MKHTKDVPLTKSFFDRDGFLKRLNWIADALGGRALVAEVMGLSTSQLGKQLGGHSESKISQIALLAEAAGVSLDWLVLGKGTSPQLGGWPGPVLGTRAPDAGDLKAVVVDDDAMMPTLSRGDRVFYREEEALPDWGLYALSQEGKVKVRRIQPIAGGDYLVHCDNRNYQVVAVAEDRILSIILGPAQMMQRNIR